MVPPRPPSQARVHSSDFGPPLPLALAIVNGHCKLPIRQPIHRHQSPFTHLFILGLLLISTSPVIGDPWPGRGEQLTSNPGGPFPVPISGCRYLSDRNVNYLECNDGEYLMNAGYSCMPSDTAVPPKGLDRLVYGSFTSLADSQEDLKPTQISVTCCPVPDGKNSMPQFSKCEFRDTHASDGPVYSGQGKQAGKIDCASGDIAILGGAKCNDDDNDLLNIQWAYSGSLSWSDGGADGSQYTEGSDYVDGPSTAATTAPNGWRVGCHSWSNSQAFLAPVTYATSICCTPSSTYRGGVSHYTSPATSSTLLPLIYPDYGWDTRNKCPRFHLPYAVSVYAGGGATNALTLVGIMSNMYYSSTNQFQLEVQANSQSGGTLWITSATNPPKTRMACLDMDCSIQPDNTVITILPSKPTPLSLSANGIPIPLETEVIYTCPDGSSFEGLTDAALSSDVANPPRTSSVTTTCKGTTPTTFAPLPLPGPCFINVDNPMHGSIRTTYPSTDYEVQLILTCDDGYIEANRIDGGVLASSVTVDNRANIFSCVPIPSCATPTITNGRAVITNPNQYTIECDDDYDLSPDGVASQFNCTVQGWISATGDGADPPKTCKIPPWRPSLSVTYIPTNLYAMRLDWQPVEGAASYTIKYEVIGPVSDAFLGRTSEPFFSGVVRSGTFSTTPPPDPLTQTSVSTTDTSITIDTDTNHQLEHIQATFRLIPIPDVGFTVYSSVRTPSIQAVGCQPLQNPNGQPVIQSIFQTYRAGQDELRVTFLPTSLIARSYRIAGFPAIPGYPPAYASTVIVPTMAENFDTCSNLEPLTVTIQSVLPGLGHGVPYHYTISPIISVIGQGLTIFDSSDAYISLDGRSSPVNYNYQLLLDSSANTPFPGSDESHPPQDGRITTFQVTSIFWIEVKGVVTSAASVASPVATGIKDVQLRVQFVDQDRVPLSVCPSESLCNQLIYTDPHGQYSLKLKSDSITSTTFLLITPFKEDQFDTFTFNHTFLSTNGATSSFYFQPVSHSQGFVDINFQDVTAISLTGSVQISTNLPGLDGCPVGGVVMIVYLTSDTNRTTPVAVSLPTVDNDGSFSVVVPPYADLVLVPMLYGHTFEPSSHQFSVRGKTNPQPFVFNDITTALLEVKFSGGNCDKPTGDVLARLILPSCTTATNGKGVAGFYALQFPTIPTRVPAFNYRLDPSTVDIYGLIQTDARTNLPIWQNTRRMQDVLTFLEAPNQKRDVSLYVPGLMNSTVIEYKFFAVTEMDRTWPLQIIYDQYATESQYAATVITNYLDVVKLSLFATYGPSKDGEFCYNVTDSVDIIDEVSNQPILQTSLCTQLPTSGKLLPTGACRLQAVYNKTTDRSTVAYVFRAGLPIPDSTKASDPHDNPQFSRRISYQLASDRTSTDKNFIDIIITGTYTFEGGSLLLYPPAAPLTILRDPPGGSSYTSLAAGRQIAYPHTTITDVSSTLLVGGHNKVGTKVDKALCVGSLGESVCSNLVDLSVDVDVSFQLGGTLTSHTEYDETSATSFTETVTTSQDPSIVDGDGDLFLCASGSATVQDSFRVSLRNGAGKYLEAFGEPIQTYTMNSDNTMLWISPYDIKNTLIPNLVRTISTLNAKQSLFPGDFTADDQHEIDTNTQAIANWNNLIDFNNYLKTIAQPHPDFVDGINRVNGIVSDGNKAINPSSGSTSTLISDAALNSVLDGIAHQLSTQDSIGSITFHGVTTSLQFDITSSQSKTFEVTLGGGGNDVFHLETSDDDTSAGGIKTAHSIITDQAGAWSVSGTYSPSGDTEVTNTVTVYLADPDIGDEFQVQILVDPVFATPIFKLIGGQSRCTVESGTLSRDFIELITDPVYTHQDPRVPIAAVVRLSNFSPTQEQFSYSLSILPSTNLNGLVLSVGGTVLNSDTSTVVFTLNPASTQTFIMLIARSPGSPYQFDGITITASGIGAGGNCNSTNSVISVEYDQPCNLANFFGPLAIEDTFLVNQRSYNSVKSKYSLPVSIANPEYMIRGRDWSTNAATKFLQSIQVQYRYVTESPSTFGRWNGAELVADTVLCQNGPIYDVLCPPAFLTQAAQDGDVASFNWDLTDLTDGSYEIRVVTQCAVPSHIIDTSPYTSISKSILGRFDRHPPEVFGLPFPSVQLFFPGMAISVQFTESISCDTLGAPLAFHGWINPGQNGMNDDPSFYHPPLRAKCVNDLVELQFMSPQWDLMIGHACTIEIKNVFDLAGNTQLVPIRWTFQIGVWDIERSILHINNVPLIGNYSTLIASLLTDAPNSIGTNGGRRLLQLVPTSINEVQLQFQSDLIHELATVVNVASRDSGSNSNSSDIAVSQLSVINMRTSGSIVFVSLRVVPNIISNGSFMSPAQFANKLENFLQFNFTQRCVAAGLELLSTIPTNLNDTSNYFRFELQPLIDNSVSYVNSTGASTPVVVVINSDGSLAQVPTVTTHTISASSALSLQVPYSDVVTISFNVDANSSLSSSAVFSVSYSTVYDASIIDYDVLAHINSTTTVINLNDPNEASVQHNSSYVMIYLFHVSTQTGGKVLRFDVTYTDAHHIRHTITNNIFIVGPPVAPIIQEVFQINSTTMRISFRAGSSGVSLLGSPSDLTYAIALSDSWTSSDSQLITVPASWLTIISSETIEIDLSSSSTLGFVLPLPGMKFEWRLTLQASTIYARSNLSYANFTINAPPASIEINRIVPAADEIIGGYRVFFTSPTNTAINDVKVGYQLSVESEPIWDLGASNSIQFYDAFQLYTSVPVRIPSVAPLGTVYFLIIANSAMGPSVPLLHLYSTPFLLPPGPVTVNEINSPIQSDNLNVNISWLPTNQTAIQPESDLFLGYRIVVVSLNPTFNVSYQKETAANILTCEFADVSVMGLPYVVSVQSLMNSSRNLAVAQRSDGTGIQVLASVKSESIINGAHVVSIDSIVQLSNDSIMITFQALDAFSHINQYQAVMLKSSDSTFVTPANQYLDMTKNTILISGLPMSESGRAQSLVFAVQGRTSIGWSRLSVAYQFYLLSLQHQVNQSVMHYDLVGPKQLNITYASGVTNANDAVVSIYWSSNNTETLDIIFRQEPFYLTDNLDEISMNGDLPIRQFHSNETSDQFEVRYIPSMGIRTLTIFDLPVQAGGSFYFFHVQSRMHTFQFSQTVFVTGSPTPSMIESVNQISLSQVNMVYVPTRFSGLVNSHENLFGCAVSEYGTSGESIFVQMRLVNSSADYVIVPITAMTHSSVNSILQFRLPSVLLPLPGESLVYDVCLITSTPVSNVSSICLPVVFNTIPKSVTFVLTDQLGLDLFRLKFKAPLDASQSIHTYQGGFSYDDITMVQDPFVNHTVSDWNGVNASIVIRIDPVPTKPTHMIYLFLRSINKFGASEFHRHAVYPSWLSSPTIIDIGQVKLFDHSESGGDSVSVVLTWLPPTLVYPRPGLFIGYDIIVEPARLVPGNSERRIHLQVGSNISTVTISGLNPSISDYTALIVGRMQSTGNCIQRLFGLHTIISQPDIHSFALLPPPDVVFINSTLQTGPTDIRLTFQPVASSVGPIEIYRAAVVTDVAPYITYPSQTLDLVTNSILITGLPLCSTGSICSIVVLIQAWNIGGWSSTQPSVRKVVNYVGRPNAPFVQSQYQVISTSTINGRVALFVKFQDQVLESMVTVTFTPDGSNTLPLVFNLTIVGMDPVYYHEFDLPVILGGVWYTCTVTASNVVGMSDANREKLFLSNPFPVFPLPPNCCQSRLFSDTTSTMSFILPTSYQDEHYVLTRGNPIVDTAFTGTLEQALWVYADPNKKECVIVQLEGVRINSSHSPSISSTPFTSIIQTDGKPVLLSEVFKMNKATEITFYEKHDDKQLATLLEQLNNVRFHVDIKCTTPSGIEHQPDIVSFTCFEFSTTTSGRVTETVLSSPLLRSQPSICQPMVLPLDAIWPTRPMQQYNSSLTRRFTVTNQTPVVPINSDPTVLAIELSLLLESNSTIAVNSTISLINPIHTHFTDTAAPMPVESLTNETLRYPGTNYIWSGADDNLPQFELVSSNDGTSSLDQFSSSSTASSTPTATESISTVSISASPTRDISSSTGNVGLTPISSSSTEPIVSSTQADSSANRVETIASGSASVSMDSSSGIDIGYSSSLIGSSGGESATGIISSSIVTATGGQGSTGRSADNTQPLWWSRSYRRDAIPIGAVFPCTLHTVDSALMNDTDAFGSTLEVELCNFMNVSPDRFKVKSVKKLAKSTGSSKSVARGQNKAVSSSGSSTTSTIDTVSIEATVIALPSNINSTDSVDLALSLQNILSTLSTDSDMSDELASTGFTFQLLQAGVSIGTIQLQPAQTCIDGTIRWSCTNESATLVVDDSTGSVTSVALSANSDHSGIDIPSGLVIPVAMFAIVGLVGLLVLGVWILHNRVIHRRHGAVADYPIDNKKQPELVQPTMNLVVNAPEVAGGDVSESDMNIDIINSLVVSKELDRSSSLSPPIDSSVTLYTNASTPRATNTTNESDSHPIPTYTQHDETHVSKMDHSNSVVTGSDVTTITNSESEESTGDKSGLIIEPIGTSLDQVPFTPISSPSKLVTSPTMTATVYGQLPNRQQLSRRFFASFSPNSTGENTIPYQSNTNTTS